MNLNINDTFNKELPIDPIKGNYVRQVKEACMSMVAPTPCSNPIVLHASVEMLNELGMTIDDTNSSDFVQTFSGNKVYVNTQPYAMCYGGHQFGNWAGQLGDGRAINLFEVNHKNKQWAVQLKGAGKTPYSRSADGLAVLRSSVREYLCSEAMHHLGVPTTRALSIMTTGDDVLRDILYNGNPSYEKGAIVTRVAPSFIRFGNFQIFAANRDLKNLKNLVDYTIKHHFPHLGYNRDKTTYLQFFKEVVNRTLELVIHWQRVGFVHGVMNTDNMSVLGLTIDYGPYGWLEDYDPDWTPNTTDAQNRRYRYSNQPMIALWNLTQLGNALYPLVNEVEPLEDILNRFRDDFKLLHHKMISNKLGLFIDSNVTESFIENLQNLMAKSSIDMTLFYRKLSRNDISKENIIAAIEFSSYKAPTELDALISLWDKWISEYLTLLALEKLAPEARETAMKKINPKYVLRNYMAQLAIDAADRGDNSIIDELYQLLKTPYDEIPAMEKWFVKRPDWAKNKVGCSQLSCSS